MMTTWRVRSLRWRRKTRSRSPHLPKKMLRLARLLMKLKRKMMRLSRWKKTVVRKVILLRLERGRGLLGSRGVRAEKPRMRNLRKSRSLRRSSWRSGTRRRGDLSAV